MTGRCRTPGCEVLVWGKRDYCAVHWSHAPEPIRLNVRLPKRTPDSVVEIRLSASKLRQVPPVVDINPDDGPIPA